MTKIYPIVHAGICLLLWIACTFGSSAFALKIKSEKVKTAEVKKETPVNRASFYNLEGCDCNGQTASTNNILARRSFV